jgi:Meckel syndrome type 1 protein
MVVGGSEPRLAIAESVPPPSVKPSWRPSAPLIEPLALPGERAPRPVPSATPAREMPSVAPSVRQRVVLPSPDEPLAAQAEAGRRTRATTQAGLGPSASLDAEPTVARAAPAEPSAPPPLVHTQPLVQAPVVQPQPTAQPLVEPAAPTVSSPAATANGASGNGAALHAPPTARDLSAARAGEGKLIRFPASPTRRDDDLASDPPPDMPEPVREPELPKREPAVVRRIEREPSEPPPAPIPAPTPAPPPPEVAPRVAEAKPAAKTLMAGSTNEASEAAAPASDERSSGVQSPPAPLPVQWPTLRDADDEGDDEDEHPPRSRPEPEDLHDQFFSAGEEGSYEGGPASLIPAAVEEDFDHQTLDTIPALRPRTPAQELRRRNFILMVAAVIGFGLAVSVLAVWNARRTRPVEPPVASEPVHEGEQAPAAVKPGEPLIPAPPPEEPGKEPELPTMALPAEAPPAPARAGEGAPVAPVGVGAGAARPPLGAPASAPAAGPPAATPPAAGRPSPPPRANNPVTGRPPTASFPVE